MGALYLHKKRMDLAPRRIQLRLFGLLIHVCIGLGLMSFLVSYESMICTLLLFLQISIKTPAQIDIVFLSGSASKNPTIEERISKLTGDLLHIAYCILILSCVFVMRCKETSLSKQIYLGSWVSTCSTLLRSLSDLFLRTSYAFSESEMDNVGGTSIFIVLVTDDVRSHAERSSWIKTKGIWREIWSNIQCQ